MQRTKGHNQQNMKGYILLIGMTVLILGGVLLWDSQNGFKVHPAFYFVMTTILAVLVWKAKSKMDEVT